MNVLLHQNHFKIYLTFQFALKKIKVNVHKQDHHKEQLLKNQFQKINHVFKNMMKDQYQKCYRKVNHLSQLNKLNHTMTQLEFKINDHLMINHYQNLLQMDSFKLIKIDSFRILNKQIQPKILNLNNTLKLNRINNNNPLNNKILNHSSNNNKFSSLKINNNSNHNKLDYLYKILKQLLQDLKLNNRINNYLDHKLELNHKLS